MKKEKGKGKREEGLRNAEGCHISHVENVQLYHWGRKIIWLALFG